MLNGLLDYATYDEKANIILNTSLIKVIVVFYETKRVKWIKPLYRG